MDFVELSFSNIKLEIENYLRGEYKKANILFNPSSPYGQVLSVLEDFKTKYKNPF